MTISDPSTKPMAARPTSFPVARQTAARTFIIPAKGKDNRSLSPSFTTLLAKDGITLLQTDKYGQGLVQTQKTNFVPRIGLAYELDPRTVIRGGFGMFYNSFENQGYGPNIGENYPFVYNFNYLAEKPWHPERHADQRRLSLCRVLDSRAWRNGNS